MFRKAKFLTPGYVLKEIFIHLAEEAYKINPGFLIPIIAIFYTCGCYQYAKTFFFRPNYQDAKDLIHETRTLKEQIFLKANLKNGDVFQDFVRGMGSSTAQSL